MATAAATAHPHISKTPGICGGKACIDGTRIRVIDIVGLYRQGLKPEEMLDVYASHLSLAQVFSALAYAEDHPGEIEADIRTGREAADQIERERKRFLRQRRAR